MHFVERDDDLLTVDLVDDSFDAASLTPAVVPVALVETHDVAGGESPQLLLGPVFVLFGGVSRFFFGRASFFGPPYKVKQDPTVDSSRHVLNEELRNGQIPLF